MKAWLLKQVINWLLPKAVELFLEWVKGLVKDDDQKKIIESIQSGHTEMMRFEKGR